MIMGYAKHGKATATKMLGDTLGLRWESSSKVACAYVCYGALKDKYGYTSMQQCFADHVNHLTEWRELIKEFCAENKSALAEIIFHQNDIYVGIRCEKEFKADLQNTHNFIKHKALDLGVADRKAFH